MVSALKDYESKGRELNTVEAVMVKLCHAILVLCKGFDILLTFANASKACFVTYLSFTQPQALYSSVLDDAYIHTQS